MSSPSSCGGVMNTSSATAAAANGAKSSKASTKMNTNIPEDDGRTAYLHLPLFLA